MTAAIVMQEMLHNYYDRTNSVHLALFFPTLASLLLIKIYFYDFAKL